MPRWRLQEGFSKRRRVQGFRVIDNLRRMSECPGTQPFRDQDKQLSGTADTHTPHFPINREPPKTELFRRFCRRNGSISHSPAISSGSRPLKAVRGKHLSSLTERGQPECSIPVHTQPLFSGEPTRCAHKGSASKLRPHPLRVAVIASGSGH